MKLLRGALLLALLSTAQARTVDFEDFVGRYLGTVQIEQRGGGGNLVFQGRGSIRIRDERIVIRGDVRRNNEEVRIDCEFEFDEDDAEDQMLGKPIFPLFVTNGSPFRWTVVGDKTWLVLRTPRVSKIKGGYRMLSGDLARRDGSRARGNFSLERQGEEVTLEYFYVHETGDKLVMTVNADR